MREMQRREEGLVAGIQRHHETVEHVERRLRRLIRSGLSLVDLSPIQPTAARKMRM
jgi:hypothetical protein